MIAPAAWLAAAPRGRDMEIDTDRIDEAVLALLYLGLRDRYRAWKGFDWDAMDRDGPAARKGFHLQPRQQGQVGRVHRGGLREAERLFRERFAARR